MIYSYQNYRLLLYIFLWGAASAFFAGCATYHAAPLSNPYIEEGLQPPDTAAVCVLASDFHHPLLQPLHFDLRDGLSPDEAAIYAVVANPTLQSIRAQRGVVRAHLLAAGLLPNPTLDYELAVPTGKNTEGEVVGSALRLGLDIQGLITRGAERSAAQAQVQAVDLDVAWQEWQVAQQARLQVYRIAYLHGVLDLAREGEAILQQDVATVRRADSLHLVTAVETTAAESALESARQVRLTAEQEQARARLALNQSLGLPPDAMVDLETDTVSTTLPALSIPEERQLLDSLQIRRLDLIALRRGYESQDQAVHAAVLRQFPAINIGFVRSKDTGNFITIGPAVSLGLPFFDRNQGQIAVERATREQLYREYEARLFQTRHMVDSLLVERRITLEQITATQRLVTVRERLVAAYREARRTGDADIITFYQVFTDLLSKRMDLLRLEQTLAELDIALEVASGTYFLPEPAP